MKSCWKGECKDAEKGEKALKQHFKGIQCMLAAILLVMFFVIKSEPEQNATSFVNGLLKEIE